MKCEDRTQQTVLSANRLTIVITSDPAAPVDVSEPMDDFCRNSENFCHSETPDSSWYTHITLASTNSSARVLTETFQSVVTCTARDCRRQLGFQAVHATSTRRACQWTLERVAGRPDRFRLIAASHHVVSAFPEGNSPPSKQRIGTSTTD